MKIKVQLKDPDALYDAIDDALAEDLKSLPEDEAEAVHDIRLEKIKNITGTWFEYGEYLTVEIDTDAKTCVVVPVRE